MNERPPQFIPGSPVIICAFEKRKIGTIENWIGGCGTVSGMRQPHQIIRRATFDEYLETVKPEYRDWIRRNTMAEALFYEVTLD